MIVCIIRHGKAHAHSDSGLDEDRRLKRRGRRQASYLADHLPDYTGPSPRLVSSPFARARQTAELVAERLGLEVTFDHRLEVGSPASEAIDVISETDAEALCLFGHNPQLECIVSLLTQGPTAARSNLRTGEAVICELFDREAPIGAGRELARLRLNDEDTVDKSLRGA
ncbi:MAG: hypothetical protein D6695_00640 [Planctomycetota bacterium]|nr:MAG: hypothetical protein D6695_00640 [Planctomycetota bacterium]